MDRTKGSLDRYLVAKLSTNKVVCNISFDSFPIEKVKFLNAQYNPHKMIEAYIDFDDFYIIAEGCRTKKFFENIAKEPVKFMGGRKKNSKYGDAPESHVIKFRLGTDRQSVFIDITVGKGRLGNTGLIIPDGAPEESISVPVKIPEFVKAVFYTEKMIDAYLVKMVNGLIVEKEAENKEARAKKQAEANTPAE